MSKGNAKGSKARQLCVWLPADLRDKVEELAQNDERSLAAVVRQLLQTHPRVRAMA